MTQLMKTLVEKLQDLPEGEQDEIAASLLDQLQPGDEEGEVEPYASFKILREAKMQGRPDESVAYERALYGREIEDDA